jgi:uncharacterized protein
MLDSHHAIDDPQAASSAMSLDELDAYLSSDEAPPECMMLSDLDGFLTGIIVGPYVIAPSEWLPAVWDGEPRTSRTPRRGRP